MRVNGFTLIELILVIAMIGTLAAVAAPSFLRPSDLTERAYHEELKASLRQAQKVAMASGCSVQVRFDTEGAMQAWRDANCALSNSGYDHSVPLGEPVRRRSMLVIEGFSLMFDRRGIPVGEAVVSLCGRTGQVAGLATPSHCLSVEAGSGWVR